MTMKTLILTTIASAILAGSAVAQGRPDTRDMTCQQVRDTIDATGAMVMSTGQHTFDRFVATSMQCATGEAAVVTDVPTIDVERCIVYRCQSVSHDDRIWGR